MKNWVLTDNDCHQHIRSNGDKYELVQFVWLDTTSQDKANGLHEYCVVHAEIEDMDNLYPEEIECYLSAYGYTQKGLEAEYGIDGDRDLIAECVLETDCLNDSCVIAEFDTQEECIKFIDKYVKEN